MDGPLLDLGVDLRPPAAGTGCSISVRNVTRSFGTHRVLSGIDLDIDAGSFVAIVGRSGCGKSTLLRLLTELDSPTSGVIAVDGRTQGWCKNARLMFQEPRLLPWERVADNVTAGITHAPDRAARHRQALAVLSQVGLAGRGRDWPSVLSGGQRQRVALARALASHPRLLAFDEPLGALDALTRLEMQELIERVWRQKGFTAIVVTHDVAEAVALADRILLLEDGAVAMDLAVDLPRPRRRGDPIAAAIEGEVLRRIQRR